MNSCFLRLLQMITEWTTNGFSIPCWAVVGKTTKRIYFFKIFVQKLHVTIKFHSFHTYCMFGEVFYPKLANVQNKIVFFKEWRREKNIWIYIYRYIYILYFTWSRVIFCRVFVYSQGDICIVKQQWWRKIKRLLKNVVSFYVFSIKLKFYLGLIFPTFCLWFFFNM